MELAEFLKKYNPPPGVARMVNYRTVEEVLVKDFAIYDASNLEDPLVQEKNTLLKENPSYYERPWCQQGPCSNWGISVYRLETEKERDSRIKNSIEAAVITKRQMIESADPELSGEISFTGYIQRKPVKIEQVIKYD